MSKHFLDDVILFNKLDKDSRANFIFYGLLINGLKPQKQVFQSCFGKGMNIFTFTGNIESKETIIISAHYDGDTIFDNAGGVIALLEIAKKLSNMNLSNSIILLFTDQEENYQQGSHNFMNLFNKENIINNINIDGYGIGDELFSVSELIDNNFNSKDFFLTDSDIFKQSGIPSISYFSAFREDFYESQKECDIYSTFKKYEF